jgi:hypothetical protein
VYEALRPHTQVATRHEATRHEATSIYVSAYLMKAGEFAGVGVYVSIRQHTSAYVSIRQHTSAYVSIRQHR